MCRKKNWRVWTCTRLPATTVSVVTVYIDNIINIRYDSHTNKS